jgi:acyl-coenzyme A synthetase/AMP-(fatty) acid ligase
MQYTYGLSILNSHFLKGCSIAVTGRSLMDKGFWDHLRGSGATTFGGVPYTYEMLKRLRFEQMDLPSLKVLTQAGGALGAALAAEFAGICERKGIKFFTMYGQVEATARIAYLPSEFALSKAGSIGIAIPGGELWLEKEELVYRGDNVAMGYATGPDDLAKGYDHGDVLHTGDLARQDEDGFFYIVGRKKRFVKLFGNRISLDDVERQITEFGYPCACAGDDRILRIYTTDTEHHGEIRAFIAARTGIHPSGFEVRHIENLPRNASGKILYSELP